MGIGRVSMYHAQPMVQSVANRQVKDVNVGNEQKKEVENNSNKTAMELSVNPNIGANFDISV